MNPPSILSKLPLKSFDKNAHSTNKLPSTAAGHLIRWIETSFSNQMLTFALLAGAGVIVGSFLYSILFRKFRIEWFSSWGDFFTHIIGGLLMGIGGVLAMGCTIGQAVTGASTLAMGSFITFFAIVFGSALTMKIQYYKIVLSKGKNPQ